MLELVFLIHFSSSLFMLGIIWFVQIVHYPLFSDVGKSNFIDYEKSHVTKAGHLIAPIMLVELVSGGYFYFLDRSVLFLFNLVLLILIWGSTFLIQVKYHQELEKGFSEKFYNKLVDSNWIRTVLWSFRAIILAWMILSS